MRKKTYLIGILLWSLWGWTGQAAQLEEKESKQSIVSRSCNSLPLASSSLEEIEEIFTNLWAELGTVRKQVAGGVNIEISSSTLTRFNSTNKAQLLELLETNLLDKSLVISVGRYFTPSNLDELEKLYLFETPYLQQLIRQSNHLNFLMLETSLELMENFLRNISIPPSVKSMWVSFKGEKFPASDVPVLEIATTLQLAPNLKGLTFCPGILSSKQTVLFLLAVLKNEKLKEVSFIGIKPDSLDNLAQVLTFPFHIDKLSVYTEKQPFNKEKVHTIKPALFPKGSVKKLDISDGSGVAGVFYTLRLFNKVEKFHLQEYTIDSLEAEYIGRALHPLQIRKMELLMKDEVILPLLKSAIGMTHLEKLRIRGLNDFFVDGELLTTLLQIKEKSPSFKKVIIDGHDIWKKEQNAELYQRLSQQGVKVFSIFKQEINAPTVE